MALLPDADIQRLKTEISLLRLIESQGHVVTRQGKDAAIRCPFHEGDDTPSLVISPASNLFHCFACEAAGSVIDWVMKTRGVSFRFACEILQRDAGLVADHGTATVGKDTTTVASELSSEADRQTTLARVIDYYHATLQQSPEAHAYLERRGLNDPALITTFRLGFANRTLGDNAVDAAKGGHSTHTDAKAGGDPHTHWPTQHNQNRRRETARSDGTDLEIADDSLRNGTMRERTNRGDHGGMQ